MSTFTPAGSGLAQLTTRDFDYGVGDDIDTAVQQVRTQIAARIRRAADLSPEVGGRHRLVYELAARIAEDRL